MGFSASYWQITNENKAVKRKISVQIVIALLALLLIGTIGRKYAYWLLPGDRAVTAGALEHFADDLKAGETFSTAAEAFCCEILNHE